MKQIDAVIFHANCNDGFCGAWLAHWAYPDAEFIPAHYGQEPPDVKGKNVLVVDFSYKRGVMLVLAGEAKSLTVLDHHKTAMSELDGLADECGKVYGFPPPAITFDMEKSGGRLMWEWMNRFNFHILPDAATIDEPPWIVDYTEDRDLWRWALPESRAVNAALASYPLSFEVWDTLARIGHEPLIPEGKAIVRYQAKVVDDHIRNANEITIAGHRVLAVNATTLFSDIAGKLAEDAPFGVAYFDRQDGKRQYSLRSRDGGVDVSEIAAMFGGGGHVRAAGFEADPGRSLEAV